MDVYKKLVQHVRFLINFNITLTCKIEENQESNEKNKIFHFLSKETIIIN